MKMTKIMSSYQQNIKNIFEGIKNALSYSKIEALNGEGEREDGPIMATLMEASSDCLVTIM